MKKVVIFCNAPFYVQQTLGLYERYRGKADISIFILQVEGLYKFLDSLDLELERLEFLPSLPHRFRLASPVKNLLNMAVLSRIKKRFFKGTQNANIFFPGEFLDPVMHACVAHLLKKNRLTDFGYPSIGLTRFRFYTWKQRLFLKQFEWMTGAKTYLGSLCDSNEYRQVQFFDDEAYDIPVEQESVDFAIIRQYSWQIDAQSDRRRLLFMENNLGHMYWHYEASMRQLLDVLKDAGFQVYIKPHPRIGCSPFLKEAQGLKFVPEYVPAQFIRDDDFYAVGSLGSTALIDFVLRRENVFCFELLFEQKNANDRSYGLHLMTKEPRLVASGGKILMPGTFQELKELLQYPDSSPYTPANCVQRIIER
jgi:hypothetical protein